MNIQELTESTNIAENLDDELLTKIGKKVVEGYNTDVASRKDWEREVEEWTKLALQTVEQKTYPWPKASNVKYPLVSVAAMQFQARAFPSLIPSNGKIVKVKTIGGDPDGAKQLRAERVGKFMDYQICEEMENWEEDMDRLLVILPIIGMAYKKTYFCPIKQRNESKLVLPQDLVVNYWSKTIEDAERKTEILYKTKREVKEKQLNDIYLDVELGDPQVDNTVTKDQHGSLAKPTGEADETTPYIILEQHGWFDLDEDGLAEPYIFTVDLQSEKVLRIVARYIADGVKVNEKGDISSITPIEYYTKYECIPNPDGSGYGIGFGKLLGSINHSVDTLINQLIDAGSLNNLQAGFIGKGLRIRKEDARFTPGEWKQVNSTVDDLRKGIFPLPTKEPSPVLFQLLGMLVQAGKELASVAEIFVGKMPGQNTPAYTTKETVEQGMKLFTAIYKRVYRSMKKEFRKLYQLNSVYLDPQQVAQVLDDPMTDGQEFTGPADDIYPAADPMATSKTEREAQAQQLAQLVQFGVNPIAVVKRILEAMEIPKYEELLPQGPPPNPEQQKMEMEMQMKQQESQMKMQLEQVKIQIKEMEAAIKLQTEQVKASMEQQRAIMQMRMEAEGHKQEMQQQYEQAKMNRMTGIMDMQSQAQQHQMGMKQQEESHKMGMKQQQQKQTLANKQKKSVDKK